MEIAQKSNKEARREKSETLRQKVKIFSENRLRQQWESSSAGCQP